MAAWATATQAARATAERDPEPDDRPESRRKGVKAGVGEGEGRRSDRQRYPKRLVAATYPGVGIGSPPSSSHIALKIVPDPDPTMMLRPHHVPLVLLPLAVAAVTGCEPSAAPASSADGAAPMEVPLFPSANRPDVRGTHGAVVSDHPLASAAAHAVLVDGGNAMDAAIAAAGVLAVVRPHMNGVGGDAFALVYEAATGEVHALNGSGRAGALANPAFFADLPHRFLQLFAAITT